MQLEPRQSTSGLFLALGGVFLFSLKPIFVKMAYQYAVDSVILMTLRIAISLPVYLLIGLWLLTKNKVNTSEIRKLLPTIVLTGLIGYYGASYFDLTGLQYVSAQLERMILFSYPGLVVLIGYRFFGIPISKGTIPALFLTYTGVLVLFAHDLHTVGQSQFLGGVLIFTSAVLFALYILFSKKSITRVGSLAFTCIAMSAASVAIVLHFLLTRNLTDLQQPDEIYQIAFAIALLSTVLPSFMISEAIHRIGTNSTSIIGSSGALLTSLMAVLLLDEMFTVYHAIALLLVTTGILWLGKK